MGASVVSIVFTSAATALAFLLAPKFAPCGKMRIAAIWAGVTVCAYLIPNNLTALVAIGFVMLTLAPLDARSRVYLYIAILPALPHYFTTDIPFPGLNYLIDMDFAKLAALAILGPVFVGKLTAPRPPALKTVDVLLLAFVFVSGVLTIRELPFTSMVRATANQFILVFIPYVAISRTLQSQEDVTNAFKALFFSIAILAFIGVISTARHWNYYAYLADSINYKVYVEHRSGLLRIYGPLVPTLLGYLMGVGVVCAMFLQSLKERPGYYMLAILPVFGFTALATGSRGAWIAAIATVAFYILLPRLNKIGRSLLVVALAGGVFGMVGAMGLGASIFSDPYGTFAYREELLRTSLRQIADYPLFGSAGFRDSPRFAHLVQGEGIVDIVNSYLQVALSYGLVGFGLIFGANFVVLRRGLKILDQGHRLRRTTDKAAAGLRSAAALVALHMGFLAMIATVSAVSYVWHYGFIILGLTAAQARVHSLAVGRSAQAVPEESKDSGRAPPLPGEPRSESRLPYGARFVRRI